MEMFLFINRLIFKLLPNFYWEYEPRCKMIGEGEGYTCSWGCGFIIITIIRLVIVTFIITTIMIAIIIIIFIIIVIIINKN